MSHLHLPLLALSLLACYASAGKVQPFKALIYRSTAPSRTYRHQNVANNDDRGYIDEVYQVQMDLGSKREFEKIF